MLRDASTAGDSSRMSRQLAGTVTWAPRAGTTPSGHWLTLDQVRRKGSGSGGEAAGAGAAS